MSHVTHKLCVTWDMINSLHFYRRLHSVFVSPVFFSKVLLEVGLSAGSSNPIKN